MEQVKDKEENKQMWDILSEIRSFTDTIWCLFFHFHEGVTSVETSAVSLKVVNIIGEDGRDRKGV